MTKLPAASPNAKIFASHIKLQHNAMQLKSEFESMFQEIKKPLQIKCTFSCNSLITLA